MKQRKNSHNAKSFQKSSKDELNILHERAIKLAETSDEKKDSSNTINVIQFTLNNEIYGIESSHVTRVCEANKIAFIPGVPAYIEGVMNVHGKMISVINLKNYFGLENTQKTDSSRVIIIGNNEYDVGLIVDAISEIIQVDSESIQINVSSVNAINANYLRGITCDQKIILDAIKLLNSDLFYVNDTA